MGFGLAGGDLEEGARKRDSTLDWILSEAGLVLGCGTWAPLISKGED